MKDYSGVRKVDIKSFEQIVYDSMRLQTAMISNMNPYVKQKIRDPRKLIEFAWERKAREQKPEDMVEVLAKLAGGITKKKQEK